MKYLLPLFAAGTLFASEADLEAARDRQDRAALEKQIADLNAAAAKAPNNAQAHYEAALAYSYLAEVSLELRERAQAQRAAEAGAKQAERAIALKPDNAEYHRVLGTLYGQIIPANVLAGLGYGKKARDAIATALQHDPKSSRAYIARGVGSYYLPDALGGGADKAAADFRKAIEFDSKSAEAYLWLGLSLRKMNKNAEARQAFTKSLELDPRRVWTKQQLDKTPAR